LSDILILYYSRHGATEKLAQLIARGVEKVPDFAILTNEISKATFGKTVSEYKHHKSLKNNNLRDHALKSKISGILEI